MGQQNWTPNEVGSFVNLLIQKSRHGTLGHLFCEQKWNPILGAMVTKTDLSIGKSFQMGEISPLAMSAHLY